MELSTHEIKDLMEKAQGYEVRALDTFEIKYEKHTLRKTNPFGNEMIEDIVLPNIKIVYK